MSQKIETKIYNGKDNFLYCSIDSDPSNYMDGYDSSEECIDDIKQDIIDDCKLRNYTEEEIKTVVSHYEIVFNNTNFEWKNLYK